MQKIDIGIFIVNGQADTNDYYWAKISIENIINRISRKYTFKVFLWNHDINHEEINNLLQKHSGEIIELTINDIDIDKYDPYGSYICDKGYRFSKGYHIHRTPLQLLYEYATKNFIIDSLFTFDTDSWPLRHNWDLPLMHALNENIKLVGVWRDELKAVIPPYVHPSCLGIKNKLFQESGLRFDIIPKFPKEDSLSSFTAYVSNRFGKDAIFKLERNNALQYHSVFNGVYGSLIYHHHFGSRTSNIKTGNLKSFGWKERNENMFDNYLIMKSTTSMVFNNTNDFEALLLYGNNYSFYKKYKHYLETEISKKKILRLFVLAKQLIYSKPVESFIIFNLIMQYDYLISNKSFRENYAKLTSNLGFKYESSAYLNF